MTRITIVCWFAVFGCSVDHPIPGRVGDTGMDGVEVDAMGSENCNGADNDEDGSVDEGCPCTAARACGGLGICSGTQACERGLRERCTGVGIRTMELCDPSGLDEDCDGTSNEGCICLEGMTCPGIGECVDGFQACTDAGLLGECVQNGHAVEECDGLDNDCDGATDESLLVDTWPDEDEDGYGSGEMVVQCPEVPGWPINDSDCDDTNMDIHPGALEKCNGVDDDCDDSLDETLPLTTFYRDADGDTYGTPSDPLQSCAIVTPTGYASNNGDCDDSDESVNSDAAESCNARDDDCDTSVDEGVVCTGCATGFIRVSDGAHVYQFCETPTPWSDAGATCLRLGYEFVRIDDNTEQNFLWTAVPSTNVSWWIGAVGNSDNATVRWTEGESSFLFFPESGHPIDGQCVALTRNNATGVWANLSCDATRLFVCESP